MKHNIVPLPNKPLIATGGSYTLTQPLAVDFGSFDHSCATVFAERTGLTLQADTSGTGIVLVKNTALAPEEHSLTIAADKITVEASTEVGVIWALTSLYHLLDNGVAPCVQLSDAPKFKHRALMLDSARHFYNATEVKKVIEEMSLVKMSVFHWHLSDDQGFRIQSDIFPQLHKGQDYFTKDEVRDVVAYAKLRGIEVIPEIDMPGHTSAIVAAMPQLTCHGTQVEVKKQGGIYKVTLCPGKDATYDFLTQLLDEVCELFESPYFHIGGDESPHIEWETCEDCKRAMQENGITEVKGLQSYFTKRVADHLISRGKKPIVWNDFLDCPGARQDLDVQFWIEFSKESKLTPFFKNGGNTVFSTMPKTYFDYPHSVIPLEKVYSFTPEIQGEDCSKAPNTKGIEACLWTERVLTVERLQEMLFPRTYALAEAGWSNERDYASFAERILPLLSQLTKKGINFVPASGWNPEGEERRKLVVEFFKMFVASMSVTKDMELPDLGGGSEEAQKGAEMLLTMLQLFELNDPLLIQDLMAAFAPPQ